MKALTEIGQIHHGREILGLVGHNSSGTQRWEIRCLSCGVRSVRCTHNFRRYGCRCRRPGPNPNARHNVEAAKRAEKVALLERGICWKCGGPYRRACKLHSTNTCIACLRERRRVARDKHAERERVRYAERVAAGKCAAAACERPLESKSWCAHHLKRFRRYYELDRQRRSA